MKLAFGGGEWIVERVHEEPPHQVHHHNSLAGSLIDAHAAPGRSLREILRAQEPLVAIDGGDDLASIPDMIAGGHDIGAGLVELARDLIGDADAARGVLAVDDNEINCESRPQAGQMFLDRVTAGAADHIAEEQNLHATTPLATILISLLYGTPRAR